MEDMSAPVDGVNIRSNVYLTSALECRPVVELDPRLELEAIDLTVLGRLRKLLYENRHDVHIVVVSH
jgi:hypothetical protein